MIGGEGKGARIQAEQEFIVEAGHPDDPMRITSDLHRRDLRPWDGEKTEAARGRVEATDLTGAHLGEPDHPLGVHGDPKGSERLHTPFGREWVVAHEACVWIEPPQAIGVEFGEPDLAMAIQYEVVRRAWQRECLACVAGIRCGDSGQRVETKLPGGGKIVT